MCRPEAGGTNVRGVICAEVILNIVFDLLDSDRVTQDGFVESPALTGFLAHRPL